MKKNFLWSMLTILMVIVLGGGMMSCSDDPEPTPWQWSDGDGQPIHLTSVSRTSTDGSEILCNYAYNGDKLKEIAGMTAKWNDEGNYFELKKSNADGTEEYRYEVYLTGRGLVEHVDLSWSKEGTTGNAIETWKCNVKFEYSIDKQLVKIVKDASYTNMEDATNNSRYMGEYNYVWENGMLTKCKYNINNSDKKEVAIEYSKSGTEKNPTLQFPYYIASKTIDEVEEEEYLSISFLAAVGLLGVGPAHWPSQITFTDKTYSLNYTKDSKQRIQVEQIGSNVTYKYTY